MSIPSQTTAEYPWKDKLLFFLWGCVAVWCIHWFDRTEDMKGRQLQVTDGTNHSGEKQQTEQDPLQSNVKADQKRKPNDGNFQEVSDRVTLDRIEKGLRDIRVLREENMELMKQSAERHERIQELIEKLTRDARGSVEVVRD